MGREGALVFPAPIVLGVFHGQHEEGEHQEEADGGGDGKEVSATDRIIAAHAKATGVTKK